MQKLLFYCRFSFHYETSFCRELIAFTIDKQNYLSYTLEMSENNLKEIWDISMNQIFEEYKDKGKEQEFYLWFNMKYVEDDVKTIKTNVPSQFLWDSMIKKGNVEYLKKKILEISGLQDIQIIPSIKNEQIFNEKNNSKNSLHTEKKESSKIAEEQQKDTENKDFNKIEKKKNSILNENFTFENFITEEGSSNNFAYKVALSIADNPGRKINPILLYGGVGLGKTHLMQSIGNKILEKYGSSKKICYVQAESFLNEFTDSLLTKNPTKFKNKYRSLDVLLIDDIQFLQKKEGIQQELFYVFEALHKNNSQMVFTCDRPLKEIEKMEDRLVSRLSSGMSLDLQPPNFETRKAIIYKKLENKNVLLSNEVVDIIARTIETNIRDLEAAILKIVNYSDFIGKEITPEIAQSQLQNFYSNPFVGNISIDNIIKVVSKNYNVTPSDIKGKKRDKKFVYPRHIALYIAKEITEYTFSELGNEFGGRDHSSIMHACDKIKEEIQNNPNLNQNINIMIKEIKEFKN